MEPSIVGYRGLDVGLGAAGADTLTARPVRMQPDPLWGSSESVSPKGAGTDTARQVSFSWFSPAMAHARRESIRSLGEYETLEARYSPWDGDLAYEGIELVFASPRQHLRAYEGGFSRRELVAAFQAQYDLEPGGNYRDVACYRYDGHTRGWLGITDGRLIITKNTTSAPDARATLEAVIDTLTGNHWPSLTHHPSLYEITAVLDTDLNWNYTTPHDPPLPGVHAMGTSYTVTADRVVRSRNVYAFHDEPALDTSLVQAEAEHVVHDRLGDPTILQSNTLLLIEASAPLTTIDNH